MHNSNFAWCFYRSKTWSAILIEESRLRVCENTAQGIKCLRRKEKWHETGENCVSMNDNMYGLFNILEKSDNCRKTLVWRPEVRRSLGICKYRWEHNIQMDLKGTALWVVNNSWAAEPLLNCQKDSAPWN